MEGKSLHNVSLKIRESRIERIYSEKITNYQHKQTYWLLISFLIISCIWLINNTLKEFLIGQILSSFLVLISLVGFLIRKKYHLVSVYITKVIILFIFGVIFYRLYQSQNKEGAILFVRTLGFITMIMDWYIKRWILKASVFFFTQTFFIYMFWGDSNNFEMLSQIAYEIFCILMFYWSEKAKKQNFLETYKKIQHLSLHHDIINKLIPSSMIILQFKSPKDYKILYANQSCLDKFQVDSQSALYEILNKINVDKENNSNNDNRFNLLEDAYQQLYANQDANSVLEQNMGTQKEIDIFDIVSSKKIFEYKESYFNTKYSHCYFQSQPSALIFLSDETIQRKNEQLKQMDIYKDKLLARISHDLKTPLHCILSISQTFKNQLKDQASISQDMNIIQKNSELLMYMINDILDYSMIKMNKIKLNCSQFNVRNAILDLFKLLQSQASSQNVKLIADVSNNLEIYSDQDRFKQVLLNFITNSIRHTPSGFIKVKCDEISESNELQISIQDSGVGMSGETLSTLFQKIGSFNKTQLNVNGKYFKPFYVKNFKINYIQKLQFQFFYLSPGIGLGLIMCKKLINLIGSNNYIFVESKPKQGSKFIFRVKQTINSKQEIQTSSINSVVIRTRATSSLSSNFYEKSEIPDPLSPKSNSNSDEQSPQQILDEEMQLSKELKEMSLDLDSRPRALINFKTNSFQPTNSNCKETKKIKVMIVDDQQYNIIALKALLRNFKNFDISEFIFAEKAYDDLQKNQYDIIFSDIQMPILDGIQFIRKVRLLNDKIKQPLVFMVSADSYQMYDNELKDLDIQSFIQKPIVNQEQFSKLVASSVCQLQ